VSFFLKIVALIIGLGGVVLITFVYKKHGLKAIQKKYDLFFKKLEVLKINEQIIIKKVNLTKTDDE
jgi:glycine betaine/choline ABC-type transport system substrate-binding protein